MNDQSKPIKRYALASGNDEYNMAFIAYRYDSEEAFRDTACSHLGYFTEENTWSSAKWDTWVSGMWRSDSGRIYACTPYGALHVLNNALEADELSKDQFVAAFNGVFGLDDQHVWAYGGSPVHGGFVHRYDGQKWAAMPNPPGWIIQLHGSAPDCLYGVGQRQIYRWDGSQWFTENMQGQALAGIHVLGSDEIYATSREGMLYEGSQDGWIERATWDGPLVGVGKCHGTLWLGGEDAGLLKLNGQTNRIEAAKPNIPTRHFECRKHVLIPTDGFIACGLAPEEWEATGVDALDDII